MALDMRLPEEVSTGRDVFVSHLRVFGCTDSIPSPEHAVLLAMEATNSDIDAMITRHATLFRVGNTSLMKRSSTRIANQLIVSNQILGT